jgi:hypothetical protein
MNFMDLIKRYVYSTAITFAAGMLLVLTPEVQNLTPESFRDGTIFGLVLAGTRLGTKMVFEMFLTLYNSNPQLPLADSSAKFYK